MFEMAANIYVCNWIEPRNHACHNLSQQSSVFYKIFDLFEDCCTFPHSTEKTPLSDFSHSSCFQVHWLLLYSYFHFLHSVHFFFLKMFQARHDAPPFAFIPERRNYSSFFFVFLVTFPLYIYLRIRFIFFCTTLLNLALWSSLTCRSNCDCSNRTPDFFIVFYELFFCLYFSTNCMRILTVIHSSRVLAAPSSPISLQIQ